MINGSFSSPRNTISNATSIDFPPHRHMSLTVHAGQSFRHSTLPQASTGRDRQGRQGQCLKEETQRSRIRRAGRAGGSGADNIEDLIIENLANNDKKLELLDERSMGEGMYCVLPWIMYYTSILIVGVCNKLFSLDVGASWSSLVLRMNSFSDYDRHHSLGAIRR